MDTRQRQHIKDNKLELLRLTTISTELLVRLVKENIFSEAEKQNLVRFANIFQLCNNDINEYS